MSDAVEQEIQAKGLTAPRITPADIEANIVGEYYFTAGDKVDAVNDEMVNRFLGWKLPHDFGPDCYISFDREKASSPNSWPIGTNLLHAGQAREMLEHVVGVEPKHEALNLLTFCVLVLRNSFTVTGESACASPENFDAELVRKIARRNAVGKIGELMGYELRTKLQSVREQEETHLQP